MLFLKFCNPTHQVLLFTKKIITNEYLLLNNDTLPSSAPILSVSSPVHFHIIHPPFFLYPSSSFMSSVYQKNQYRTSPRCPIPAFIHVIFFFTLVTIAFATCCIKVIYNLPAPNFHSPANLSECDIRFRHLAGL